MQGPAAGHPLLPGCLPLQAGGSGQLPVHGLLPVREAVRWPHSAGHRRCRRLAAGVPPPEQRAGPPGGTAFCSKGEDML